MVYQSTFTKHEKNAITAGEFNALVDLVASKTEFAHCFGVRGCDLSLDDWWSAYARQSLDEQTKNNRLPDYLLTCAKQANSLGVIVPREYILYDTVTGEHLDRPNMIRLRKLIASRCISGVIFPALDRLSREPLHQQIFELEATYYGIQLQYADAPSGNDPGSQFARTILAHAAKLVKLANRRNNRGGNIGRIMKGWVPAGKISYGYKYSKEIDAESGRTTKAWWAVSDFDNQKHLIWGSEAWIVTQTFYWIGIENRSPYWVAKELNRLKVRPRYTNYWSPSQVEFIIRKRCYTGKHVYNKAEYVTNPNRPLPDITGEFKRTIRKDKPKEEHIGFDVPRLVSDELWERANQNLDARKGNRDKKLVIEALFRHRVYCPKCGKVMTIRRYYDATKYPHFVYYACPGNCQAWKPGRCDMKAGRIDRIDSSVKSKLEIALMNPEWAIMQSTRHTKDRELEGIKQKLRLLELKISQGESKIATIQDHMERQSGIYSIKEAENRVTNYRQTILTATRSKEELQTSLSQMAQDKERSHRTKEAFQKIHNENIRRSTFAEWLRIVEILDAKVYPSKDWSEITVTTAVDLASPDSTNPSLCYNINMASPKL
jgi:hypothetical protein